MAKGRWRSAKVAGPLRERTPEEWEALKVRLGQYAYILGPETNQPDCGGNFILQSEERRPPALPAPGLRYRNLRS